MQPYHLTFTCCMSNLPWFSCLFFHLSCVTCKTALSPVLFVRFSPPPPHLSRSCPLTYFASRVKWQRSRFCFARKEKRREMTSLSFSLREMWRHARLERLTRLDRRKAIEFPSLFEGKKSCEGGIRGMALMVKMGRWTFLPLPFELQRFNADSLSDFSNCMHKTREILFSLRFLLTWFAIKQHSSYLSKWLELNCWLDAVLSTQNYLRRKWSEENQEKFTMVERRNVRNCVSNGHCVHLRVGVFFPFT